MSTSDCTPLPPAAALWLLHALLGSHEEEHVVGDLLEDFYSRTASAGHASARRRFWRQTVAAVWSLGISRRRASSSLRTASQEFPCATSGPTFAMRRVCCAPLPCSPCSARSALASALGRLPRCSVSSTELFFADPSQSSSRSRSCVSTQRCGIPNELETGSITGYAAYSALRNGTRDFAGFGAYQANTWIVGAGTDARSLPGVAASWDFFPTLGVRPYLGRFYTAKEDDPGAPQDVVVLSYEYWITALGGNRDVVGKTISIAFRPFTVIGVAPAGFTGTDLGVVDYWIPISAGAHPRRDWPTTWQARWLQVVGRLKPA